MNYTDEYLDGLVEYVEDQLASGVSDEVVRSVLAKQQVDRQTIDDIFEYIYDPNEYIDHLRGEAPTGSKFATAVSIIDDRSPTFTDRIVTAYRRAGFFESRLRRREYFVGQTVVNLVGVLIVLCIVFNYLAPTVDIRSASDNLSRYGSVFIIIGLLFNFLSTSLIVRRVHDIGESGYSVIWLYLISIVPLMWQAIQLYLIFKKGDQADNKYGHVTKSMNLLVILGIYKQP